MSTKNYSIPALPSLCLKITTDLNTCKSAYMMLCPELLLNTKSILLLVIRYNTQKPDACIGLHNSYLNCSVSLAQFINHMYQNSKDVEVHIC